MFPAFTFKVQRVIICTHNSNLQKYKYAWAEDETYESATLIYSIAMAVDTVTPLDYPQQIMVGYRWGTNKEIIRKTISRLDPKFSIRQTT